MDRQYATCDGLIVGNFHRNTEGMRIRDCFGPNSYLDLIHWCQWFFRQKYSDVYTAFGLSSGVRAPERVSGGNAGSGAIIRATR
jgi:hypothetical protein